MRSKITDCHHRRLLLVILFWCGSFSVHYAQESFAVVLNRPQPIAGQEFQIKAKIRKGQRTAFDSGSERRETNAIVTSELLAHCTIITNVKSSEEIVVKVARFIEHDGFNSAILLPEGTLVIASKVGKEMAFTAEGHQLSPRVSKLLGELMPFGPTAIDCPADEAFGTETPKKVGDKWKVNRDCVKNAVSKFFGSIQAREIDASMTLLDIEEVHGIKCLRLGLSLDLHSDQPLPRIAQDPKNQRYQTTWDTKIRFKVAILLPVDDKLPPMLQEEKGEGVANARMDSGEIIAGIEIRYEMERTVELIKP